VAAGHAKQLQYYRLGYLQKDMDGSCSMTARKLPVCRLELMQRLAAAALSGGRPIPIGSSVTDSAKVG
jgi:hypothetical protein